MRSRLANLFLRWSAALVILTLAAGNLNDVSSAQSNPTVVAIAVGGGHNLALKNDGTVWAWGDNNSGELGIGNNTGPNNCAGFPCSLSPIEVSGLSNVTAIAAGGTLFPSPDGISLTLKSDGTVWAWGGWSGNFVPVQVPGLSDIIAIAAGAAHGLALKKDGTVWAAGSNQFGQLGIGSSTQPNRTTPVQVTGLSNVIAISAGSDHSLALKSDGTVWAWGFNAAGLLGIGSSMGLTPCFSYTCSLAPIQVGISSITAIAAGDEHSLALKKDGTVWAWGANQFGQLGIGDIHVDPACRAPFITPGQEACSLAPIRLFDPSGVVALTAGGHSLALKRDGTVWAWGANYVGQLGSSSTSHCGPPEGNQISCSPSPVEVMNLSGVVMIAAGEEHSLALKQDGTVWAWGSNVFGQLGIGATTAPGNGSCGGFDCMRRPVQVQGL